jgi:tetratricopeptide (TPR) repeat protein
MMEEILNHLYKIGVIRVPSKTTLLLYKGSQKSIGEIARELNVTYILEGSVRKDDNEVRINVQLIDPVVDVPLWSETYDKKLEDIFTIQSDVAKRVAFELEAVISPEVMERIERIPTKDPNVYDLYLKARSSYFENYEEAEEILKKIISIDTNFAPGYSLLGMLWLEKGTWWGYLKSEEVIANAKPLLEKAQKLNPQHSDVHLALAKLYLWYLWDFESAGKEFDILLNLVPSDPFMLDTYINYLTVLGRFQEALEFVEYAIKMDPLSDDFWVLKALTECHSGKLKDAEETMKMITSDINVYVAQKGRINLYLGHFDQCILFYEKVWEQVRHIPRSIGSLAIAYYKTGRKDDIISLMEDLKRKSNQSPVGSPAFYIAMIYSSMHEKDLAFKWLEKSFEYLNYLISFSINYINNHNNKCNQKGNSPSTSNC